MRTVYTKVRKAEKSLGRDIFVKKTSRGRSIFVVGRGDVERISKASGIDIEVGELVQINETLEALTSGVFRTAELLRRVASKLGVV